MGQLERKKKSDVQCNISPNQSGLVQKRVYDDAQELCLKHTKYDMETKLWYHSIYKLIKHYLKPFSIVAQAWCAVMSRLIEEHSIFHCLYWFC